MCGAHSIGNFFRGKRVESSEWMVNVNVNAIEFPFDQDILFEWQQCNVDRLEVYYAWWRVV